MLSKIQAIFASNAFEPLSTVDGILYQIKQSTDVTAMKESFWLVVENELSEILPNQGNYFSNCNQHLSDKAFNKNCNLLVLYKTSSQTLSKLEQKMIQQIEEDPYIFRKYVLYYSEEEVRELDSILNDEEINVFMGDRISNPDVFNLFKGDTRDLNGYSLLYRAITKLPYITIQCGETKSLQTINNRIQDTLVQKHLDSLHHKLTEKISNLNENEINELDALKLVELINLY